MSSGAVLAQSCHAVASFHKEHSAIADEWQEKSNYIAVLVAKNENCLIALIDKADKKGIKFSVFFEPDLDNEITSVALEPGKLSKKLCSSFKLALS